MKRCECERACEIAQKRLLELLEGCWSYVCGPTYITQHHGG